MAATIGTEGDVVRMMIAHVGAGAMRMTMPVDAADIRRDGITSSTAEARTIDAPKTMDGAGMGIGREGMGTVATSLGAAIAMTDTTIGMDGTMTVEAVETGVVVAAVGETVPLAIPAQLCCVALRRPEPVRSVSGYARTASGTSLRLVLSQ